VSIREEKVHQVEKKEKHIGGENHSLHQLRKKKHIGSKSPESPPQDGEKEANEGLVSFWKHAAPAHWGHDEFLCFQWHVWLRSVCAQQGFCAENPQGLQDS